MEEAQELLLHAPGIVHPQQEEELLELHIEEPQVRQGVLEVLGDRVCPVGDPGGEGETCQVRLHGLHRCRAKVLDGTLGALSCTEVYAGEEVKGEILQWLGRRDLHDGAHRDEDHLPSLCEGRGVLGIEP